MRFLLLLCLPPLLLAASCGESKKPQVSNSKIPKALQPGKETPSFLASSSYSERGYADLVNKLYDELLDQEVRLQDLERKLSALQMAQSDSTEAFETYDANSNNYYEFAGKHALDITDSNLRRQMETLIAGSREQYKSSQAKHEALIAQIEIGRTRIANLHQALKIARTLPVIEKYQRENLPSAMPLERLRQLQNAAVQEVEALLQKP
jgi:hypothetical protein